MSAATTNWFQRMRLRAKAGIWIEALGAVLAAFLAFALVTYLLDRNLRLEWPFRLMLLLAFAVLAARLLRDRLLRPLAVTLDDDEMALAVERKAPEIHQALISSVQFERVLLAGAPVPESKELMASVVEDVERRASSIPFLQALDRHRVIKFAGLALLAVLGFAAWAVADGGSLRLWAQRNLALSSVEWPRYTQLRFLGVGPEGLVRMPQGDSLTLQLEVGGPVPEQVFLYYEFAGGESGYELMSSTGEREFTFTLESVLEDAVLRAEGGDGLSEPLTVQVVERPRIEDLQVTMVFPEYMGRPPEPVPPTEGDVKVPAGGKLLLEGRSHKPIEEAFLVFANDQKLPLARAADGHGFAGEFVPEATGLLVVDVIDTDQLGAGTPPKLFVRLTEDGAPLVDFKTRGIGSLITSVARIPGDLKLKDDFGLQGVAAEMRITPERPESPVEPGEEVEPPPYEPAEVTYGSDLAAGAVLYESTTVLDLKPLSPDPDPASPANRIRPGMLVSVRFAATDNFGPGQPHVSYSDVITFRVVTRDKLVEELVRRQLEQRYELIRILDEEKTAHLEVREMLNPTSSDERAPMARARLRSLARQQTALGRRVRFVSDSYQAILSEYENNRILEPSKVRQIEGLIVSPLAGLAAEDFPTTSRYVEQFATSGQEDLRQAATAGYETIIQRIEQILKHMEETETLAALVEGLREVIKVEDSAIKDVVRRLDDESKNVFGPGKDKTGRDGKPEKKNK